MKHQWLTEISEITLSLVCCTLAIAELDHLRVAITAAADGAGRVIALRFARAGARICICDVNAMAVTHLRESAPEIDATVADLANEDEIDGFFALVASRLGGLDVLINNVGVAGPTAAVENIAAEEWEHTLKINLTSHFLCAQRAVKMMKPQGNGLIINISSTSAKTGLPLRLPYVVSKAALISMTHNLARELGPFGIRVNALLPGPIEGQRMDQVICAKAKALDVPPAEYRARLLRYVSLRRMTRPEDIANLALYLASPAGCLITGQAIAVDGNVEHEE